MEYSLTILTVFNLHFLIHVLILILMEYSLTICKRAIYVFSFQSLLSWNTLSVRELVPSEKFFRKCIKSQHSFQIKIKVYLLNLLNSNGLYFRKTNTCLNKFLHLRKIYLFRFSKSLKMNTLNQRPKSC